MLGHYLAHNEQYLYIHNHVNTVHDFQRIEFKTEHFNGIVGCYRR